MKFEIFKAVVLVYLGFVTGLYSGFKDGVESVEFDKARAQQKLSQCVRIIGGAK